MEKINFEDGQLMEKAYTIINGTKHYVEKATYTGTTPLSAFMLNKMQNNIEMAIEEKSSLPSGGTTGQVLAKASDNDNDVEWVEQTGGTSTEDMLPIGAVLNWFADVIPNNWLLCNGQAVSRTDYAVLFSVLSTKYGTGNGSTTFNLPDLQGRVAVGKSSSDTDFNVLGKTGGEKAHKLVVNEIPAHQHYIGAGTTKNEATGYGLGKTDSFTNRVMVDKEVGVTGDSKTQAIGGSKVHNNLQPYVVCDFIIKAK